MSGDVPDARRAVHAFGICGRPCGHHEPDPEHVRICRAWLREWAVPRASINTRRSSYGLKHEVEHAARATGRAGVYVSNGAFITAALLEGYSVRECDESSPNAFFNMSVQKTPASERIERDLYVDARGPALPLTHAARCAIASLSRAAGSRARTARILGISAITLDRALMGRRLRPATVRRIAGAVERRTIQSHEVVQ